MSIYFFGLMVVALGLEGFSRRGLPFSSTKRITGRSARAVGVLCIAFGMGLIAAFYLNSPSIERTQMNYFSWGVLFGCGWTWQATRRQWP